MGKIARVILMLLNQIIAPLVKLVVGSFIFPENVLYHISDFAMTTCKYNFIEKIIDF